MSIGYLLDTVDVSADDTVVPDGSPSLHNNLTDLNVNLNKSEFLTNSGIGGNPTILSPWLQIVERQLVSVLGDFFSIGQTLVGRGG